MHSRSLRSPYFGADFGGAVVTPNAPLPEVPLAVDAPTVNITEATPALPSFLQALLDARPQDATLKKRRDELVAETAGVEADVQEFLADCNTETKQDLQRQHEHLRAQGREQIAKVQSANEQLIQAEVDWNGAREKKAQALASVEATQYYREHLSRWASDEQIAQAEQAIIAAKAKFRIALDADNKALARINEAESQHALEQARLKELEFREARIKGALTGRAFRDEEFGLTVQP